MSILPDKGVRLGGMCIGKKMGLVTREGRKGQTWLYPWEL